MGGAFVVFAADCVQAAKLAGMKEDGPLTAFAIEFGQVDLAVTFQEIIETVDGDIT